MAITAEVRGVLGVNEETGDTIFDVMITAPHQIEGRTEDSYYPRQIQASDSDSLEAAIKDEVDTIKGNLEESTHPVVGKTFTF